MPFYVSRLSATESSMSNRKSVLWNSSPCPSAHLLPGRSPSIPPAVISVSTCSSTYLVHLHLFFHPTVSNPSLRPPINSSPNSIQAHLFLRLSISKSTYSYTTLLLNPTNVFEGIYFYIHPFLSHVFVFGATPGSDINTSVSRFSGDDVSATVATLKCRGSYQ